MSNSMNTPCFNPTLHGVKSHKQGSQAAMDCMNMKGKTNKNPSLAMSPAAVSLTPTYSGERVNEVLTRAESLDLNLVESMDIARWALSRKIDKSENPGVWASANEALHRLVKNPNTHGATLHFVATGESLADSPKGELRPIKQNDHLREIVNNPRTESRTLKVIASKAEPEVAQLATLRLAKARSDARAAFFRTVRNLFK